LNLLLLLFGISRDARLERMDAEAGKAGKIATSWAHATEEAGIDRESSLGGSADREVQYSPLGSFCIRAYRRWDRSDAAAVELSFAPGRESFKGHVLLGGMRLLESWAA
jgi:hypothetical protein